MIFVCQTIDRMKSGQVCRVAPMVSATLSAAQGGSTLAINVSLGDNIGIESIGFSVQMVDTSIARNIHIDTFPRRAPPKLNRCEHSP